MHEAPAGNAVTRPVLSWQRKVFLQDSEVQVEVCREVKKRFPCSHVPERGETLTRKPRELAEFQTLQRVSEGMRS